MTEPSKPITRRGMLRGVLRVAGVVGAAGVAGGALLRGGRAAGDERQVWQIDPHVCIQCGQCATACVLTPSAVKCVHSFAVCWYCKLCFGYFDPRHNTEDTAAENQLCPLGAIRREHIEDVFYEYTIEEGMCIGCGKCVAGCQVSGNGSLYLQIMHHLCKNCNECAIAAACPSGAIRRIPARQGYLLKTVHASPAPEKPA